MSLPSQARRVAKVAVTPSLWPVAYDRARHGPGYYDFTHVPTGFPEWPWERPALRARRADAACTICSWHGDAFEGPRHVEFQTCPRCGSIVRDRVQLHAFVSTTRPSASMRVMETSPRLGESYRKAMAHWFHYLPSDFDERAHRGAVKLDLQQLQLPDRSLDVVLTSHVLEHVPDTQAAVDELWRVLVPGGRLCLQIPLLQGETAPPETPEFHGDDTPVFWRFGFDLVDTLRAKGFAATVLCAQDWFDAVKHGATEWHEGTDPTWDVPSMLRAAKGRRGDFTVQLKTTQARRVGLWHGYQCLTFACTKPA